MLQADSSVIELPHKPGEGKLTGGKIVGGVKLFIRQVQSLLGNLITIWSLACLLAVAMQGQSSQCSAPANAIVAENCLPGNPSTQWDVSTRDAGDPTIQGFATDISFNQGATVYFKINTPASAYTINIYRLGFYGGNGARNVATITPSAVLPQTQPACITNSTTSLLDCGNWAVSASWQIPSTATSGVYFAHLIRTDTGGDSHIVFIVRNDASHSNILYQTSDTTWQAYNYYGGGSLYGPNSGSFNMPSRALKASYNRPFYTRSMGQESATWLFGSEYPMIRWLESNGYDVTYFTGLDGERNGSLILNHKVFLSSGHDEYWSGNQRTSIETARTAGVNLAFFSGNGVFWKTRWENSIDGSNTPFRTLVCYKETYGEQVTDPSDPPTWTGTWRDPTFSPPADGGRPENALTGTISMVLGTAPDNPGTLSILVPSTYSKLRFWRNTAVAKLATGSSYALPAGTLGYEWDEDLDNGSRPAGTFDLSSTTRALTTTFLLDYGSTTGAGTGVHHLTFYRASSGAFVFGAGTVQWAWGLDSNHDDPFEANQTTDVNMQQATVNLFADMGVQPATLQGGLVPAAASTDKTPPASQVTSPASGSSVTIGSSAMVSGVASDTGGGVVAGVEVSVDGGNTWHPTSGQSTWTYTWVPTVVGNTTVLSRATDDSGNIETPSSGLAINVMDHDCPCSAWGTTNTPVTVDAGDPLSTELGVKFRADYNGYITGIRFYKATTNAGTHIGNLWSATGQLMATATFTNETGSGWQQVTFASPVAITANTNYVASYFAPKGHYSADSLAFLMAGLNNPPIHLLQSTLTSANGVYAYGASSTFPNQSFNQTNYWVDVAYIPSTPMADAPPAVVISPGTFAFSAYAGLANPSPQNLTVYNQATGTLTWTAASSASWLSPSASSGTAPQTISLSVNTAGMAVGVYTGTVTFTPGLGSAPVQIASVSLTITNLLLSSNFATHGLGGLVIAPSGPASSWSVVNAALQYNGGVDSQIFAGNSAWANYSESASFLLTNLQDWPGGIRGRVNPATGSGYILWAYPALGEIILFKATGWNINQGLTQLGFTTASFDTVTFHNLGLVFAGNQIQATYDGNVVITASDATYGNGLIALEGFSQSMTFGSVVVSSATANTGSITASSSLLNFGATYQAASPSGQTVALTAGGGGAIAWTASSNAPWLSVATASGITPASVQVSVNSTALAGGTYSGIITIASLGTVTFSQTINVTLTVVVPPPLISTAPSALTFITSAAQPVSQVFSVLNAGYGNFLWSAASDSSWLVPSPVSGSAPSTLTASVNASGLPLGSYNGKIILTAPGASNSPFSEPIQLQVLTQEMTENFSDLGSGWVISPMGMASGWTASNQVYSFSGIGLSQACTGNASWSNYTFDTSIKLSFLSNWPGGVRGRVNPSTGAGYALWLYPGSNLAILYRVGQWSINGSAVTQIGQAPLTFDTASPHRLRMYFNGSAISVYWDGQMLINATDATYPSGYVCLDADSQPISYSNVQVAGSLNAVTLDPPNPSNLIFNALPGAAPTPQTINVSASGSAIAWAASASPSWATVSASNSLTPGTVTISVNPVGLVEGSYPASIQIFAPGATNSPTTIPVTLAVKTAVLSVAPASISFLGASGINPAPQNIQITNTGTGTLGWSASASPAWLALSAVNGTAPSTVSAQPNASGLSAGQYSGSVTISSPDVSSGPVVVPISFEVGALLFSDNFASAANWNISPLGFASGWSVANSSYSYNGGGPTQAFAGNTAWTDYALSANIQLSSLNDYPGGLRGRVNTTTGASYGVWLYPPQGIFRLYRIGQWSIDAGNTQLAQSTPVVMDANVHNVQLRFHGPTIQVYYDNVQVINTTDTSFTQGAVALDVYSQPIVFSNVSVITY